MKKQLKSCPFCGGEAAIEEDKEWGDCWIWCMDCKIRQPEETYTTKKEAITAWNRRAK